MALKGAIFDCDGTLLDSMPMWERVFVTWLQDHGIDHRRAEELSARYESLNFDEECYFFHDELGICESREQALDEMLERVRRGYETDVLPFEGCRRFLDELRARSVPMVIASSTTAAEVRRALAVHGLEGYFEDVLFTGDVGTGRGKDYPDVYYAALDVLGTPLEDTWVFEDAPFGCATAQSAGFPVACLFNDHDGRDERQMRMTSEVLAHGYRELSVDLLDAHEPVTCAHGPGGNVPGGVDASRHPLHALLVAASPERSAPSVVKRLAADADLVVAVDGGSDACRAAGVSPDVWCGDADSSSSEELSWVREVAETVITYPSEKNLTDLELAVSCVRHEAMGTDVACELTVTCCWGGRPDHALGNLGCLLRNADLSPRMVEDGFEARVLSPSGTPTWDIPHAVRRKDRDGMTVSVMSLSEGAVVSERDMRWNLDHENLVPFSGRGLSNEVAGPSPHLECHEGAVLAIVCSERDLSVHGGVAVV